MTWLGLAIVGVLAVALWHLRRPALRRLDLSSAEFLGDLRAPTRRSWAVSLIQPIRSLLFWVHAGLASLLLSVLFGMWVEDRPDRSGEGIGLRLIVDTSGSMSVDGRMDAAKDRALEVLEVAEARADDATFCAELIAAGTGLRRATAASATTIEQLAADPGGSEARRLFEAIREAEGNCRITHAVVISDQPRPAGARRQDGPEVIWLTEGVPVPNTGIRAVRLDAANTLAIEIARFGDIEPISVEITAPSADRVLIEPDPDGAIRMQVEEGTYTIRLTEGGAYPGDDMVSVKVPAIAGQLNWQLEWPPAPQLTGDLAVGPFRTLSPEELAGPVVAVYDGWQGPMEAGLISEDSGLLNHVNLDVLEAEGPRGVSRLPAGFSPVMIDAESGRVLIANRAEPPGAIIPQPVPFAGERTKLSAMLLFNALEQVSSARSSALPFDWVDAEGKTVPFAGLETDTSRSAGETSALTALWPAHVPQEAAPIWPWVLLAGLGLILIDGLAAQHLRPVFR